MQTGDQVRFSQQSIWEYLREVSDWKSYADGHNLARFPHPAISGHLEIPPYIH